MIVGAINVATGVMEYFRSRQPGGLTFEHVAASGSLPPSFPMTPIGEHRYWDGGLFSNTPLGPAINALEQAAGGDRAVERELVVVELFPMRAAVPRTFTDVLQRMVQLQYTSRLTLDGDFFDQMSDVDRPDRGGRRRAARRQRDPQRPAVHQAAGPPQDRPPQRGDLEPAPGAVQRRRLLPLLDRGPDPGGLRGRDGRRASVTSTRRDSGSG